MANKRVWFASHVFGAAPYQSTAYIPCHGCQNVGINTNYTLEPVQELGQLNLYQLIEQLPEIELTAEKVLDGNALIYHLTTRGAGDGSLVGRSNQRCQLGMSVYSDSQSAASGTPTSETALSGMYISQVTYTFGTDKPFMEACSFVGNEKLYKSTGFDFAPTGFLNNDAPLALAGSGGVQIRQEFLFYPVLGPGDPLYSIETTAALDSNGQIKAFLTNLPPDIFGISSSGTNDRDSSGEFGAHIQEITVSCNFGRDTVLELGRRDPYFRFIQFPVQATCQITTIAEQTDTSIATELGYDGFGDNVPPRSIRIRVREGTFIDLGELCKLQTVSFGGGGADGGQATITYNYITYNTLAVSHPQDPDPHTYPLFA